MKNARVINLLKNIISIPSYVDESTNETKLVKYLEEYLLSFDINVQLEHVKDARYNLIASYGTNTNKKLLLTGHTDTVPLYSNPELINPIIIDDKIYGRGANDMKGALAAMIETVCRLKENNIKLNGTLYFIGVIDEELGSLGTIDLIKRNYSFDAIIIGEPTSLRIGQGHRGLEWVTFKSYGKQMHSGQRDNEYNAIENMIELLSNIKLNLPKSHHPLLGSTTFNIGKISGGSQPSTVAKYCEVSVDFRYLFDQNYTLIKDFINDEIKKLKLKNPLLDIEFSIYSGSEMPDDFFHDACFTNEDETIIEISQNALKKYNYNTDLTSFSAWSDGGLLNSYLKIPTIILGPGDLRSAHSSNEHIEINQLIDACDIYYDICLNYLK